MIVRPLPADALGATVETVAATASVLVPKGQGRPLAVGVAFGKARVEKFDTSPQLIAPATEEARGRVRR